VCPEAAGEMRRAAWTRLSSGAGRIAAGAVSFVAGCLVMFWPTRSIPVIAVIIGVALLFLGLLEIVVALAERNASGGSRTVTGVLGALYLVPGAVCVVHLRLTIVTLVLLLSIVWIAGGVVAIYHAFVMGTDRLMTSVPGVASGLVGFSVLAFPTASLVGATRLLGTALALLGVVSKAHVAAGGIRRRQNPNPSLVLPGHSLRCSPQRS
jgi:uncharacterized membrane protein HdeD (DUF308 family)